jgi:hypothetical protein
MNARKLFMNALSTALLIGSLSSILFAQNAPSTAATDFQSAGDVTVGYRFADIRGYVPQYEQLFNLNQGFRLLDFTLHGDTRDKANPFADNYSVSATGLGGDPFATAQLKVAKTGLYDLRAQWRQSYYYRNQNDDVVLPITSAAPTLSTGLTDNHDWATVRKLGSLDLTLHATNRLRFGFDFYRNGTDGDLVTTRALSFFNMPMYWQAFARANPYSLKAPVHEESNRLAGGVDYSWRDWDFHYRAGFQSFNEVLSLNPLAPGQVSINPATASLAEPLTQLSWSQARRLTTPVSEFSFQGKIHPKVEWRGGYVYARLRGPSTEDFSFSVIAPSAAGPLTPFSVSGGGLSEISQPSNVVNMGFTWHIRNWWAANVDYRYSRYTSEAVSSLQSVLNGVTSAGGDDVVWKNGLSDLDLNLMFAPTDNLVIRPGIRLSKSDIETLEDGVVDDARTQRIKHARPEFRFGYKPTSKLTFRGDIHSSTSGASYTAISPHTTVAGKLIARYQPLANLSIENTLRISTSHLVDTDYRNSIRANTITVAYAIEERFSVFGGLSYDSYFAQGQIVYARTTSLLQLRDQEIHRVWQGGFDVKPFRNLGFRFSGNYDRLTGVGEISGEPPAYGPVKWPMATATVYTDLPRAGRLWLDFQRTYYAEELVPVNNFSANLLTIRFTRSFGGEN